MYDHWLTRVYLALLALFPAAYREDYGDELAYAIRASVADARGCRALLRLAWRELRDMPLALLAAHLAALEGRAMKLQSGSYVLEGPIRSYRMVALFMPFVFLLVFTLLTGTGAARFVWLWNGLFLILGLAVVGTGVLGLAKGCPAWALPTLGVLLFLVWSPLKLVAQAIILIALRAIGGYLRSGPYLQGGNFWPDALPDRLGIYAALDVAFLAIAIMITLVLLLIARPLRDRVWRDWSSLSFLLYGLAIPYVALNDVYRGLEPYEAASTLLLAAGAALFALAPKPWQRLLALVVALLLAHPLLSLGIYQIFPAQTFAAPNASFRLWEALQPVLELPVLLVLVCLPALLGLLPVAGSRTPALKDL